MSTESGHPAATTAVAVRWMAFAVAIVFCHHIGTIFGPLGDMGNHTRIADFIDLITPFAVVGAGMWAIWDSRSPKIWIAYFVVALLYVDGHGMHLAANSVNNAEPLGAAETVTHFWDEVFSHVYWYLGWSLMAAILLWHGRNAAPVTPVRAAVAVLYAFALFTTTIEGGVVALMLPIFLAFFGVAAKLRRGLMQDALLSYGFAVVLLVAFGLWQGGFPEFSELGWI